MEQTPPGTPVSAQDFIRALTDGEDQKDAATEPGTATPETTEEQSPAERVASTTVDDVAPLAAPIHLLDEIEHAEPQPAASSRERFHQLVQGGPPGQALDPTPAPHAEQTLRQPAQPAQQPVRAPAQQPLRQPAQPARRQAQQPARKPSPRWVPLVAAVIIGSIVGLVGAMVADRVLDNPGAQTATDRTDDTGTATAGPAGEAADPGSTESINGGVQDTVRADVEATEADTGSISVEVTDPLGPTLADLDRPVWVNSIRFDPGTAELTADSVETVEALARALADRPESVVEVTLRTASESSDEANLALAQLQARALGDRLVDLGVSEPQIDIRPLGRSLITVAQPVPNFVEIGTGLDRSPLRDSVNQIPTYAIGIDAGTGDLRAEAIEPLARLAEALLSDDQGRSVSLAAYAFTGADSSANDELAARAAAVVENHLVEVYGIDSRRISLIITGDAPYAVPADVGSHLTIRRLP